MEQNTKNKLWPTICFLRLLKVDPGEVVLAL